MLFLMHSLCQLHLLAVEYCSMLKSLRHVFWSQVCIKAKTTLERSLGYSSYLTYLIMLTILLDFMLIKSHFPHVLGIFSSCYGLLVSVVYIVLLLAMACLFLQLYRACVATTAIWKIIIVSLEILISETLMLMRNYFNLYPYIPTTNRIAKTKENGVLHVVHKVTRPQVVGTQEEC